MGGHSGRNVHEVRNPGLNVSPFGEIACTRGAHRSSHAAYSLPPIIFIAKLEMT